MRRWLIIIGMVIAMGKVMGQVQKFRIPDFSVPVCGVWLTPEQNKSGVPLGGLGTGFLELRSDGKFHDAVLQNNWLHPKPPADCALTFRAERDGQSEDAVLLSSAADKNFVGGRRSACPTRYFGHFPMADLDFGKPTNLPVSVWVRAFAPFIPHDYDLSNIPAALFSVRVRNEGQKPATVTLALSWDNDIGVQTSARGNVGGFFGWQVGDLVPLQSRTIVVAHVFGQSDDELTVAGTEAYEVARSTDLRAFERECQQKANELHTERLSFALDDFGCFNWEAAKKQTGVFEGVETIGQIFFAVRWNDKAAMIDFAPNVFSQPKGLRLLSSLRTDEQGKLALTVMETDDGALRLVAACLLTDRALVRWFILENRTDQTLKDVRFAYYANPDIGGPQSCDDDGVSLRLADELKGMHFGDDAHKVRQDLVAFQPDYFGIGAWNEALDQMRRGDWTPIEQATAKAVHTAFRKKGVVGVQMRREGLEGSYTIAVSQAWTIPTSVTKCLKGSYTIAVSEANSLRDEKTPARVIAQTKLAPGEKKQITFAFAWHFPTWKSSDGKVAHNRYAIRFKDAQDVATFALANAQMIERRIIAWQERIYGSDLPDWLKDALINGLYSLARNTWWLDDGRFFHNESFTGCPITETLVCRFNGSFATLLLFPELEKRTMREFARFQKDDGEIPFGFGAPTGLEAPMFHVQHPIVSSEWVLMVWRDYLWTGDKKFLSDMYPHAKKAMQFAMTLDKDGDSLINDDPGSETGFPAHQYYDIWAWFGTSAYVAGIGLAALRAAEEMAKAMDDAEFARWCREHFERGRKAYDEKLWNGRYYRLYNDPHRNRISETCLTNQLVGQWFGWLCDLGELHPKERIVSAIQSVAELNMKATNWGAVSGVKPDGTVDESGGWQSKEVVIGEVFNFATTALFAAVAQADSLADSLRHYGLTAAERVYRALWQSGMMWNQHFNHSAKDASPVWGHHYYSNMCIWALPFGYYGVAMRFKSGRCRQKLDEAIGF